MKRLTNFKKHKSLLYEYTASLLQSAVGPICLSGTMFRKFAIYRVGQKMAPFIVRLITSPNINRFLKFFHCQNPETICKVPQRLVDRVIGQWRRRLGCVVQQQGGHIEHLM